MNSTKTTLVISITLIRQYRAMIYYRNGYFGSRSATSEA
jgi:hypothetical protein